MKVHMIEMRDQVAEAQWKVIKQLREHIETKPIATYAGVFQFDEKSRRRMQDVVESLSAGWVEWLDVNNEPVQFSPSDFTRLYYELKSLAGQRVLALGAFTNELRAQLPLAVDHPAIRGEGWPS